MAGKVEWPSWRYPPDGGPGRIFEKDDVVPKGWVDHQVEGTQLGSAKQQGSAKQPESPEPTPEERANTIREIREAAAADGIDIQLADDASVDEINAAIDKLTKK